MVRYKIPLKVLKEYRVAASYRKSYRIEIFLPGFMKSLIINSSSFERFTSIILWFFIAVFAILVGLSTYFGGEKNFWEAPYFFEISTTLLLVIIFRLSMSLIKANAFAISIMLKTSVTDKRSLALNFPGKKPGFSNIHFPETHFQLLSGIKYGQLWRKNISGWQDHSTIVKTKSKLKSLGYLDSDEKYVPWEFEIVDDKNELDPENKKDIEKKLADLWEVFMAYVYYNVYKKLKKI